ncbi:MAG TPA: D-alanyl-D-alanine carboxypeptidase/D-alanyl-D-alanine-endopeptidase [Burkholderiales bacterium]|nr:D-alanyl-D-alanine carboxypeptidase/D-alanyl-D-alanine-endopeptidase [Burkholderiales bacterium]
MLSACLSLGASIRSVAADVMPPAVSAALARAGVPEDSVGLYVRDLTTGRELLSIGADAALNPASAMKLVTTFAALELLGPAYKWKTEAWLDGRLDGGRLSGNLALKGYGDPKLDLPSLWMFLRDLRRRGLREIDGDLLLDRSYFSIEPHDPAAFDNEPSRPYNTGADALLINSRALRLQFVPDEVRGTVAIHAEPELPQLMVVNGLRLAPGDCNDWPDEPSLREDVLEFSGTYPGGCGEKFRYFSELSADDYAQSLFRQLWAQVGGEWNGRARPAELPAGATLLATWESPPLADVVREINKYSVNVMARQLFLTLGARDGAPATLEKSRATVSGWLEHRGLAFPELAVENGAGLSRTDRISARHLGELLAAAYRSPLMPEFAASLSLAGVDGTLKKRLAASPAAGRSHMKTGYLEGVRALAGYSLDANMDVLAVVMIINHPQARAAQAAQDALLEWANVQGAAPDRSSEAPPRPRIVLVR